MQMHLFTNQKLILFLLTLLLACSTPQQVIYSPTGEIRKAKNVILMIGDGMGLSQISAGIYTNKKPMNIERFRIIGLQKTHSKDNLITDSSASATAMARGVKADNATFGSTLEQKAPKSILEIAEESEYATGITVTSSITHATPAAFVTYQPYRTMHENIATDYLLLNIDYLVGGGKKYFDRRNNDERNLISEMQTKGYQVKSYLDGDMSDLSIDRSRRFAYFTADSEPITHNAGRDYFIYACEFGAQFLKNLRKEGFVFVIEGSQIDWGGHSNIGPMVIDETLEFDQAVGRMLDFAERDGETLVIVTADHETGGFSIVQEDTKGDLIIGFNTKTHTATAVPVFAYGPGAEIFAGFYDNTEIHDKILRAMQLR
ncbi:MAG: alkaline phosphatase [Saprospiraceae bacterium]|nr:alkaline phosphatase [Saprospiraceae bacterium]